MHEPLAESPKADESASSMNRPNRRRWWLGLAGVTVTLLVVFFLCRPQLATLANRSARECLAHHQPNQAHDWLWYAQRLDPANAETQFLWARASRHLDQFQDGAVHLERARQLGWPKELVEEEQTLALAQSGHLREALPKLAGLLQKAGDDAPEIYEAYAIGFIDLRVMLRPAFDLLSRWMNHDANDPQPHYLLGKLCLEIEDWPRGEQQLRQAVELDPAHHSASLALAELLVSRQQPDEALKYFRLAEGGRQQRLPARAGQASCLQLLGDNAAARNLLHKVLSADSQHFAANLEMARWELDAAHDEAARKRLELLIQRAPRNPEVHYALATALQRMGESDEARQHFDVAAEIRSQLGLARHLTRQLLQNPNDIEIRHRIGQIHLEHGSASEARRWFRSVLEIAPNHRPTLELLVRHYQSQEDPDDESKALVDQYRQKLDSMPK